MYEGGGTASSCDSGIMEIRHEFMTDLEKSREVQDEIEAVLRQKDFPPKDIFHIRTAIEEALINAMKHGNAMDPGKKIEILYKITDDEFEAHILDEGAGFHADDLPDPTDDEGLERTTGRGVRMMREFMTHVFYTAPGNKVTMIKKRSAQEASA